MDILHYTAFVFFILFIVTAVIGQIIAWAERHPFDEESHIIEEARGRPSNAYLFIASLFFIITLLIELLALVLYLMQLADWL